jgi:uncharacterized membrane protein
MSSRAIGLGLSVLACGIGVVLLGSLHSADTDTKLRSVEFKDQKMQLIQNSDTLSVALAINAEGSIIGYRELPNADGTIFSHVYFYCGKLKSKDLPMPKGYTNIEAAALSDNNRVVGRTTRPIGARDGSLRAFYWDAEKEDGVQLLPRPDGDTSCDAQDISADGNFVTGYSTGEGRLRPVVWSWDKQQQKWNVVPLPCLHENNPYLMSAQLIISPDGKIIVGCCTENFLPDGTVDSALFMWQEKEGKWERKLVTSEQMYVKAINNRGQIVGSTSGPDGRFPCLVSLDGSVKKLQLLTGDVSGEARDINDKSEIVGWSDDPHGPEGGPVPCRWKLDGTASQIELSESGYGSIYAINDASQLAGMVDLIIPGKEKPETETALVLAFRTIK